MAALGTRKLMLILDGDEVTVDIAKAVITAKKADAGKVTFAQAAAGGSREYTMELAFRQDLTAGSVWRLIWDAAGSTVAYVLKPYGNLTLSADEPHVVGDLVISEPDGELIGGEADENPSARFWTEVSWVLTAKPTLLVA